MNCCTCVQLQYVAFCGRNEKQAPEKQQKSSTRNYILLVKAKLLVMDAVAGPVLFQVLVNQEACAQPESIILYSQAASRTSQ